MSNEPLTDAQLDKIAARHRNSVDVSLLVAEVRRLRALTEKAADPTETNPTDYLNDRPSEKSHA